MISKLKNCDLKYTSLTERLVFIPELLTRITLGVVFAQSGWGKLQNLDRVIGYFESLGIPAAHIQAPFVAGLELVAGVLILVGFATRFASLPLVGVMIVAVKTAKWEDVEGFSSVLELSEFLYIVLLLWLVVHGSKVLSFDSWWRSCKICK